MRVILVRHGESVGNFENRLQGQEDYELTELGIKQAALTGERLASEGATAVYTSPLLRAAATAGRLSERLGVQPVLLSDLSEYHFGELAGQTYAELRQRFNATAGAPALATERVYPGEEGRDVFFKRVTEAIWQIVDRHPQETVAIVSHGGPIALFCQSVLGLPYRRPMPFSIDNCSLTTVEFEPASGHRGVLQSLNDTCHLHVLRRSD